MEKRTKVSDSATSSESYSHVSQVVAFLDGEDNFKEAPNPIHSSQGAKQYGFSGALVGGVTNYSWACAPIIKIFGKKWLAFGYIDLKWIHPIYPDDRLTIIINDAEAERQRKLQDPKKKIKKIKQTKKKDEMNPKPKLTKGLLTILNHKRQECVVGVVGIGRNPDDHWVSECELSLRAITGRGVEALLEVSVKKGIKEAISGSRPRLSVLDEAELVGKELTPMTFYLQPKRMERYAATVARDGENPLWKKRERKTKREKKLEERKRKNSRSRITPVVVGVMPDEGGVGGGLEGEYQYKLNYGGSNAGGVEEGYWGVDVQDETKDATSKKEKEKQKGKETGKEKEKEKQKERQVALPMDGQRTGEDKEKTKRVPQVAHPAWIAGQVTIFLEHSYQHLPAIHTKSRIQHLGVCFCGQQLLMVGRIVKLFEKKGNQYCVLHAALLDMKGRVLTLFEHTTIFEIASKAKL